MSRIFIAVRHSNDPTKCYGGLWSANFYPALRELGCEILESKTDLLPTSRFMTVASGFTRQELEVRAQTTERILDEVREAKRQGPVDMFLSYFYNAHFDPVGFDELKRLGIPAVNFFCNNIHQFSLVADVAARVEFSWHPERDARQSYLSVGANPICVQMGADPELYHPVAGCIRRSTACFVGQRYADRDRLLAALIDAGVPVDIYGVGWGRGHDPQEAVLAGESTYLGRRQIVPGTLASYMELMANEIKQSGKIDGVRNLLMRAVYRKQTRRLLKKIRSRAKGIAGDLSSVFSAYELCLNFSNVWLNERPGSPLVPHVRLRDFEATMCRACYLTGHNAEIEDLYAVGRELDTYRDAEELVDKARFYLSNPTSAERLRTAGHVRALNEHTWRHRFQELFRKIGLKTG